MRRENGHVIMTDNEFIERSNLHYSQMVQILRYERALKSIVNVLGPDTICDCEGCGLHEEAHDALQTAKQALLHDDQK